MKSKLELQILQILKRKILCQSFKNLDEIKISGGTPRFIWNKTLKTMD